MLDSKMGSQMADFDESLPVDFYFEDLEFYEDAPAPSQDIWKKFELLPTPPRSPKHDSFEKDDHNLESDFEIVSERLDTIKEEEHDCHESSLHILAADLLGERGDMQSNLIQDCMWSAAGLSASLTTGTSSSADSSTHKPSKSLSNCGTSSSNASGTDTPTAAVEIPSSECVDPIAVFPFPINEPRLPRRRPSCSDVPMTPSDSEEEEEIDVVTVEKNHKVHIHRRRRTVLPASSSMSAQVAAMHNYSHCGPAAIIVRSAPQSPAHHHSLKRQHPASSPGSPQPFIKRLRTGVNEAELRTVVQKLNMKNGHNYSSSRGSSRASSDSEEGGEGKRAQHNVLERKRRNDLKYNFLQLRDALPDVAKQDKAAKVVILKRAVEHIQELQYGHRTLKRELEHEQRVQQRLRERLSRLDFFN